MICKKNLIAIVIIVNIINAIIKDHCHHYQVKRAQAEADSSDKKEKLKSGEKPFYLSKAKKKEADLVAKYEELQSKGGLDTFMRKTTKKKDSKERKKGLGVTVK